MAAKLPVLVSNIEGPMEVVLNGKLGSVFRSENINDLAKKICENLLNPNSKRIDEAYDYTLNNYQIKIMVEKYIKLYVEIKDN